jgi:flagellar hook-associated protein FlgK
MPATKLLGKTMPGKAALTIGQIEAYLTALSESEDHNAVEVLQNICFSILERFAQVHGIAMELSKPDEAYKNPTAMGVANGLTMALNYFNGSIAGENNLVHLPEGGFTAFNPMAVKTRPQTYYVHKKDGGRFHLLTDDVEGDGVPTHAVYRNLKTGQVLITYSTTFAKDFEKKELS